RAGSASRNTRLSCGLGVALLLPPPCARDQHVPDAHHSADEAEAARADELPGPGRLDQLGDFPLAAGAADHRVLPLDGARVAPERRRGKTDSLGLASAFYHSLKKGRFSGSATGFGSLFLFVFSCSTSLRSTSFSFFNFSAWAGDRVPGEGG